MSKILNGYSYKDVQRIFDIAHAQGAKKQTHKDYANTIYRNIIKDKGFIELYKSKEAKNMASVAIEVVPNSQGQGIGKRLVEGAKAVHKELEIDRIEWYCKKDNKASVALAKSCGFRIDNKLSTDDWYTLYYNFKVINESTANLLNILLNSNR